MAHQRRHVGNEAVQHQTYKESSQNTFHADKLHQPRAEEHHGQNEDILHHIVVVTAEEPAPDARQEVHDEHGQHHEAHHQPKPEEAARLALEHTADDGQHEQRQRIGDGRTAHGNAHTALARDAVADDNGIGHQRMRGIHTGQQDGSDEAVLEQKHIGHHTDADGDDESQQAQRHRFATVLLEVGHVHLQARQKHDVINTYLAKKLKTAVAHQDVKPMFSDSQSGQNHADDVRDAQLGQQDRRKQNDEQYKEENPCRVGYGKFQTEV